jgi:hypothetical protein
LPIAEKQSRDRDREIEMAIHVQKRESKHAAGPHPTPRKNNPMAEENNDDSKTVKTIEL